MEKFNIENLFYCKTLGNDRSNALDVLSIAKQSSSKSFTVNNLIETRENTRKRILRKYMEMYEGCLKKIDIANNLKKTDLLYTVKESIPSFPEYNPNDCIDFIQSKLHECYMDTHKINRCTLFITWVYIELNKKDFELNKNKN